MVRLINDISTIEKILIMEKLKFCVDCKHHWKTDKFYVCTHPDATSYSEISLVTGHRRKFYKECDDVRGMYGKCGKDGVLFEGIN